MKNPELDYYRAAIGQILADAGINRSTIREMVQIAIKEKVEKEVNQTFSHLVKENTSYNHIRAACRDVLGELVKEEMKRFYVKVEINERAD